MADGCFRDALGRHDGSSGGSCCVAAICEGPIGEGSKKDNAMVGDSQTMAGVRTECDCHGWVGCGLLPATLLPSLNLKSETKSAVTLSHSWIPDPPPVRPLSTSSSPGPPATISGTCKHRYRNTDMNPPKKRRSGFFSR